MKRALPFLLSAALVAVLLLLLDWDRFGDMFSLSGFPHLAAGVSLYLGSMLLRSLRLTLLFPTFTGSRLSWGRAWDLTTTTTFANHILPMRTGEAVFVILSKYSLGLAMHRGAVSLVLLRIYDLIGILLIFVVGLGVMGLKTSPGWNVLFAVCLGLLLLAAIRVDWFVLVAGRLVRLFLRLLCLSEKRWAMKVLSLFAELRGGLDALRRPWLIIGLLFLSVGAWLLLGISFWQMVHGFGIDIGLDRVIVGSVGAVLSGLLPINAAGSIGTLEAAWSIGFVAVGMDRHEAIASGIGMHLVVLVVTGIVAGLSLLRMGIDVRAIWRHRKQPPKED